MTHQLLLHLEILWYLGWALLVILCYFKITWCAGVDLTLLEKGTVHSDNTNKMEELAGGS